MSGRGTDLRALMPKDARAFHAEGLCPVCGERIIVDGAWPDSWGPRPPLAVLHIANGDAVRHQPEFTDARKVTPGLDRRRPRPS